ncbi:MAG: HAD family hydrolase [Deltaproteobacteria bacterium]|nr:HAD family hydrolase [Deltaproteobacteria bacterium]
MIFDVDLTLIDTLEACYIATNLLSDRFGLPTVSHDEVLSSISLPQTEFWLKVFGEVRPEFHEFFRDSILPKVNFNGPIYPEAKNILNLAKSNNFLLGVATNRENPWLDLVQMDLAQFFDTAVGVTPLLKPKPNPDILLQVIKQLFVPPSSAIFVGDSTLDMLAAKAAGIRGLGLTQGGTPANRLFEAGAWMVKDNLGQLKDLVFSKQL